MHILLEVTLFEYFDLILGALFFTNWNAGGVNGMMNPKKHKLTMKIRAGPLIKFQYHRNL